jgi:leucyl-tRNA synthetase
MVDFNSIEQKWQQRWFSDKIFEPVSDGKKKKFFFTVPYPYVSGPLHAGHGRTYVNGDVLVRFKRMQGFNIMWPIGFHITGTPVLAVSAKIAAKDETALKLYSEYVGIYEEDKTKIPKIVESFKEPWNLVNYFSSKIVFDFKSMGFSLDLSRMFTTGDKEYNAFVTWQFHKYREKGYLTQASYPLLYCVNCKNAVGEDDIQDADTDPVDVQKFTLVKFDLGDGGSKGVPRYLVSATLRPDTLFGITNVFVKPDLSYVLAELDFPKAKIRHEEWIISKDAFEKLCLQNVSIKNKGSVIGYEFVGKSVTTPTGKVVPVLPANFIVEADGTGVVHSVPAHAPFDYVAIEELKADAKVLSKYPSLKKELETIEPIQVISSEGYSELPAVELVKKQNIKNTRQMDVLKKITQVLYKDEFYNGRVVNSGQFDGLKVEFAKDKMAAWLIEKGLGFYFYEASRQAKCRCTGKVIAAVLSDQWFLDFNKEGWKNSSGECLREMEIFPKNYRKQFEDIFAWLDKRPCARRRGLGTQLPFANEWIIESLSDSTIYPALYTVIKEIRDRKMRSEQLTLEFFDYIFLKKGSAKDVAVKTGLSVEAIDAVHSEFEYWYPCDQRHTAIAHITNHLSFYIFAHTAIFPSKHWPKSITVNELLISEGTKMSKSKGNVVTLDDIRRIYFADLYRLYSVSTADFSSVLDFRKNNVESCRKSFLRLYSALENGLVQAAQKDGEESDLTRWMISKFESRLKSCTVAVDGYQLRDYAQSAVFGVLNDWEYFQRRASDAERAFAAHHLMKRWILLLSPLIPHTCEELWESSGENGFASLASWPEVEEKLIDRAVEHREEYIKNLIDDLKAVKERVMRKNPKMSSCKLIVASDKKWVELLNALKSDRLEGVCESESVQKHLEKFFFALKEMDIKKVDEKEIILKSKGFIEKEIGLSLVVENESESEDEKASRSVPLKPSIVLG